MKSISAIFIVLLLSSRVTSVLAQATEIDSLEKLLKTNLEIEARIDILNQLAYQNFDVNDSLALAHARKALKASIEANYPSGIKYANSLIGLGLLSNGKHTEAIQCFERSDDIIAPDSKAIAAHNQILLGFTYGELGKYDTAWIHYLLARQLTVKFAPEYLPSTYINMAWLCKQQWRNQKHYHTRIVPAC